MCQAAKLQQEKINTRDIGFSLGPRINAIGRLTNTLDALRLLCTRKLGFARKLATTLSDINRSRQELTSDMLELAQASIDPENLDKITIVASDSFHEGIIGLIASKLVDTYHRPAIVIAQSDQLAKGSARSIPGFNITNFIRHFRQQLIDAGGHEQAAGLSIASEKLNDVIAAMRHYANETITDEQLVATLTLEAPVSPDILHHPLLPSLLVDLEPYGPDNPELMMSVQAPVINVTTMGKQKEHLKVTLVDRTRHYLDILVWQYEQVGLPLPAIGQELLVAGQLQFNLWQGRNRPQILARDWRIC